MNVSKMWSDFDDFELACLCADYGHEDLIEIVEILPVRLGNRAEIEKLLTQIEFDAAYTDEQESLDFNQEVAYN